jgi:hypothetical protein
VTAAVTAAVTAVVAAPADVDAVDMAAALRVYSSSLHAAVGCNVTSLDQFFFSDNWSNFQTFSLS